LEFNVPFQHKYGYIRDEEITTVLSDSSGSYQESIQYKIFLNSHTLSNQRQPGHPGSITDMCLVQT